LLLLHLQQLKMVIRVDLDQDLMPMVMPMVMVMIDQQDLTDQLNQTEELLQSLQPKFQPK
jgi:hypothetical protein